MSVGTTILDVAAYAAAAALAASKLIKAVQPLWAKLPRVVAVAAPVLVLDLPQVAHWLAGAVTGTDVLTAVVTSVALLLPGLAEAESGAAPSVAAVAATAPAPLPGVQPPSSGSAS